MEEKRIFGLLRDNVPVRECFLVYNATCFNLRHIDVTLNASSAKRISNLHFTMKILFRMYSG